MQKIVKETRFLTCDSIFLENVKNMAMIRTSALRFAMRTTAVRQNPFDLNRTGEFHKKYEAEHGDKFKYAYVDCGPSMAPWMNLPTESKPNPFGDYSKCEK